MQPDARILKKYPNRRLYDTRASRYVTLDDVRKMVLDQERIEVHDSRTGKDLTRSVLLQIIASQEEEGHAPLLTNRLLAQLIRFYGSSYQNILSRYIEQSVLLFLDQQERYQRNVRSVISATQAASPVRFLRMLAGENATFWQQFENRAEHRDRDVEAAGPAADRAGPDSLADVEPAGWIEDDAVFDELLRGDRPDAPAGDAANGDEAADADPPPGSRTGG